MENTPSGRRKLNPFAFPPDTNGLFILMVVAAIMWAIEPGQVLIETIPFLRLNPYAPLFLLTSILLLTLLIYGTHPIWIRRRGASRSINRNDDPLFWDSVSELTALSHISSQPAIEIGSSSRSTNARVFGFPRRHIMHLERGLRLLLRQNRRKFRAIILHELAHIANGDIARTYLTQAIWIAVSILILVPLLLLAVRVFLRTIVFIPGGQSGVTLWSFFLFKILCMFLLMAGLRRSILKSRELFADQRAGTWGADEGLVNILQANTAVENQKSSLLSWAFHPSSKERLEVLKNPNELFQIGYSLPVLAGILIGLTSGGIVAIQSYSLETLRLVAVAIQSATGVALPEWTVYLLFLVLASPFILMIAVLFSNSLGIAVQRSTIADMAIGEDGFSNLGLLAKAAGLLTIGFEAGNQLAVSSMLHRLPELLGNTSALLFFLIVMTILFIFVFSTSWMVLIYLRFLSRRIIGSYAGIVPPQRRIYCISLAASILLMCFYVPIFNLHAFVEQLIFQERTIELLDITFFISLVVAFLLYWVLLLGTYLGFKLHNSFYKLRCPVCTQITHQKYAVGQACESCGNELAPWVYVR